MTNVVESAKTRKIPDFYKEFEGNMRIQLANFYKMMKEEMVINIITYNKTCRVVRDESIV